MPEADPDISGDALDATLQRLAPPPDGMVDYDRILQASAGLLLSPEFTARPVDWRISAIETMFSRVISTQHAQAGVIAALTAPHFHRLLRDPSLALSQACRLHDALWGMWWCAAASLDDMRPIHAQVCLPFHDFLERRGLAGPGKRPARVGRWPLRIAYLLHYAHGERGNAVAPLVVSLARAHAALPGRDMFVYAVQWADAAWLDANFAGTGVVVRMVAQGNSYERLDDLFDELRADHIDVVIADISSSITSVLFGRRVAPGQLWIDMGVAYWHQPEVDLIFQPGKSWRDGYPYPRDHTVDLQLNQRPETIFRTPDPAAIAAARAALPAGAKVLGVFSRLIKITPAYLSVVRQVLLRHPAVHFVIAGTGDPRAIAEFMAAPELAGRITLLHRNVDLAVYGRVIDIFLDTFPFIGALACREIAAQGVPILGMRTHEWDRMQTRERDPFSIAEDVPALLKLIDRALADPAFRAACAAATLAAAQAATDVAESAREVDQAILGLFHEARDLVLHHQG